MKQLVEYELEMGAPSSLKWCCPRRALSGQAGEIRSSKRKNGSETFWSRYDRSRKRSFRSWGV